MRAFAYIRCALLMIGLFALLAGCGKSDKDQIRKTIFRAKEAYENEDTEKFLTCLSEDCKGIATPVDGEAIQFAGKEAIEDALISGFRRWDHIRVVFTSGEYNWMGGVAASSNVYEHSMTDMEKDRIREVIKGKVDINLNKIDGIWKINRIENTIESWQVAEN